MIVQHAIVGRTADNGGIEMRGTKSDCLLHCSRHKNNPSAYINANRGVAKRTGIVRLTSAGRIEGGLVEHNAVAAL